MGILVLHNCRPFIGSADLTGVTNKTEFSVEVEEKDSTVFVPTGNAWKSVIGSIKSASWTGEGFAEALDASKVDDTSFADIGVARPLTVAPETAAVGSIAYVTGMMRSQYQTLGGVGEILPWNAEAKGVWPVARGAILSDPGTARTATGNAAAVQLTTASAAQYAYMNLHVVSWSGTGTLTARIEGDNAVGFPSPVTVGTFTAASGLTSEAIRIAGPITDNFFRAAWTVTGTPSALIVVGFGIQ